MPRNFSFVLDGVLAGLARPRQTESEDDLVSLAESGVAALVSLTEEPLDPALVEKAGLEYLHLPVADFGVPSVDQIRLFVEFVRAAEKNRGGSTAVHCGSGLGRTGTMLACYLVAEGRSPDEAIAMVREARPGSVETPRQEELVRRVSSMDFVAGGGSRG